METIVNADGLEVGHQQTAEIETSTGAVSVVHVTTLPGGDQGIQVISTGDEDEASLSDKGLDSKKRREYLARRPSYRHILNDLSSTDGRPIMAKIEQTSDSEEEVATNLSTQAFTGIPIQTAGLLQGSQIKLLPAQTIQLASDVTEGSTQGLQTLTMTNVQGSSTSNAAANASQGPTIVQYAQSADGQFLIPVSTGGNLQYQLAGTTASLPQGVVVAAGSGSPHSVTEGAMQKRELRLLKNKEAARECRRKKKEYVKCLENRVAVLENQNKTLIEELKSLKELYCQKDLGQS